jgi:hypothetical protein
MGIRPIKHSATPNHGLVFLTSFLSSEKIREMLLGICLTCLSHDKSVIANGLAMRNTDLGRLANFLSDGLPLIVFVIFDCIVEGLFLILGKLSIVHILVL